MSIKLMSIKMPAAGDFLKNKVLFGHFFYNLRRLGWPTGAGGQPPPPLWLRAWTNVRDFCQGHYCSNYVYLNCNIATVYIATVNIATKNENCCKCLLIYFKFNCTVFQV